MSKYITEFQQTGNCKANVGLICKDWNERFSISTWINDEEEIYIFIVLGKRKNQRLCKAAISKEQALEIVKNLKLVHIKSGMMRSGGAYHNSDFVKSEIERITKIKQEKEQELTFIRHTLYNYEVAV